MNNKRINVLVAPNSMKGSMSASEFADVVEEAFLKVSENFSIRKIPVADGGDFTGEILRSAFNAKQVEVMAHDPVGRPVMSKIAISGKKVLIEMADASGIKLMKGHELNPMDATSYGTGELIAGALEKGCTEILLGIGGSATVDGGSGMMEALGFRYYDKYGERVRGNGNNLATIASVESCKLSPDITFRIITDVDNPLLGDDGAATVFGPQKGASPEQVVKLEKGLASWCSLLEKESGKSLKEIKGAGAAGGIAIPLIAYNQAEIVPGAAFVLSVLDFDKHVEWADLVITGEGKLDRQTLNNKAPKAVADAARKAGKPVLAIGGTVEKEASVVFNGGAFSFMTSPVALDDAIANAKSYLSFFSSELAKCLLVFIKK